MADLTEHRADPVPLDLRVESDDAWAALAVPRGWEPVAAVTRQVWGERHALADRIVDAIVAEVPAYRGVVPRDDLRTSALRNLEMMLVGLAERRGPAPDEVAVRRALGRRRAEQGFPSDALLEGFEVGYCAMWDALTDAVPSGDADTARLLLQGAATFWRWVHDVSRALAETYAATVRSQEARLVSLRQRFVDLVASGETDTDEVERVCRAIGLEPDASFQVTVVTASSPEGGEARQLQAAVDRLPGAHAAALRGARLILVSQGTTTDEVMTVVAKTFPGVKAAHGLVRDGLAGARLSCGDAELALAVAGDDPARYDQDWLWATLTRAAPRLQPLLEDGGTVARDHPHLAETVLAFADAGFSVTEAARALDLHANSVAYRLERWHSLTGWDPRTFPGLARSLAAIRLS